MTEAQHPAFTLTAKEVVLCLQEVTQTRPCISHCHSSQTLIFTAVKGAHQYLAWRWQCKAHWLQLATRHPMATLLLFAMHELLEPKAGSCLDGALGPQTPQKSAQLKQTHTYTTTQKSKLSFPHKNPFWTPGLPFPFFPQTKPSPYWWHICRVWPFPDVLLQILNAGGSSPFTLWWPVHQPKKKERTTKLWKRNATIEKYKEVDLFMQSFVYTLKSTIANTILWWKLWLKSWKWILHSQRESRGVHLFVCMIRRRKITAMSNVHWYVLSKSKTLISSSALK